ncbi:MBL fold metallo-hydrolase [Aquibacillus halophilus]|uniref:MBL fold metallo-hydrolase n=1 Tax=Aquibacillus halophilus TaxID=930132 RepID=A0A6A8DJD3_9BACI|nr:MBL fold metallo-hydrolase [Aquibacillus halophilus]MRH41442.1 MBL fold metallo-hydrolase [Aquibacillus halophilus]
MYKSNLVAIFSILTILLLSGCGQEPIETNNKEIDTVEQGEDENSTQAEEEKSTEVEDKSSDSSTQTDEEEMQDSNNNEKVNSLSELKVHYIDVGQADSTLLQFSHDNENYTILIDAGNWNQNNVVNYLNSQSVSQIDIAIGTHPDADHIGQLDKVLNSFEVGEIWLSGNTSSSKTFQRLLKAIDSNGVDYYEPRAGDEFEVGPLEIAVLYPSSISENDNKESISLKLTYNEIQFIFTGDADKSAETTMLNSGFNLQADILQLGHHGSSTSTQSSFLDEVDPSIAIYSAGSDNSYGHPHDEVVNLVQNSNIDLYGTDVHGTIIVSTDGKDYKVLTNKDGTVSPSSTKDTTSGDSSEQQQDTNSNSPETTDSCIDVNSATVEKLQEIIQIGPARAKELIDLRPYSSVDDLSRINGIGLARIEDIKSQGLACIGG